MTLHVNNYLPSLEELHEHFKKQLEGKYNCALVPDRFSLTFTGPQKCVLIQKSLLIGVGIVVNKGTNSIDIDGIVPNPVLDRIVFGNFLTRLLLIKPWKKLEKEVARVLSARFN